MDLAADVPVTGRAGKPRVAELHQPELECARVEPDGTTHIGHVTVRLRLERHPRQTGPVATPLRRSEAMVAGERRGQQDVGVGRVVHNAVVRQRAPVTGARQHVTRQAHEGSFDHAAALLAHPFGHDLKGLGIEVADVTDDPRANEPFAQRHLRGRKGGPGFVPEGRDPFRLVGATDA